jgi:hypothetical protein
MAGALLLNCHNGLRAGIGSVSYRVFMEFLYLCCPFPLEFLCTHAEIMAVNGRRFALC